MRKQARRLWFGDWQPAEPANRADSFEILPEDASEAEAARAAERQRLLKRRATGAAAIVALALLGFLVASSQDHTLTFTPPQVPPAQIPQAQTQPPQQNSVPPGGFGGADLTGNGAAKAARAALSKYPGSIERVTAGPSGGYVVHVFTADGYEVHVLVSNGLKVLGSDGGGGGPPPGAAPQGGSTKSS